MGMSMGMGRVQKCKCWGAAARFYPPPNEGSAPKDAKGRASFGPIDSGRRFPCKATHSAFVLSEKQKSDKIRSEQFPLPTFRLLSVEQAITVHLNKLSMYSFPETGTGIKLKRKFRSY